jgi:diguanylate cyclase (GGDEF)-like protein
MIVNAGIIALLLMGKKRKTVFFLFTLVVAALMIIEYKRPDVIIGYESELVRYIDFSFGLFVCLFSIAVLIAVLIDSYMKELEKSKQYLAALEVKNKEIEEKNRMLEMLSKTDYLTGAFNNRFITSCLMEEMEESSKNQTKLTVAMIDIDNFKVINDTYGHIYGDYVLKRVASTLKSNLRKNDVLGRYGGDEFFIILRDTSKEEGYELMEHIRRKILELNGKTI